MLRPPSVAIFSLLASVSLSAAAVVLSVDVNDAVDSPTDTTASFVAYVLSDNTLSTPPFTVDINPANGAALDDVHRATPVTGGALTLGAIYRDCVFAAGDNTANFYRVGLDAVIGGLTPGKKYALTVWSYDSGATGARTSDWSVAGLGGPHFAANNYSFDGATLPSDDSANRFTTTAYADMAGVLTVRGRPAAQSATTAVFLNGFTVDDLGSPGVTPAPVLALDFNDRGGAGATNTMSGFTEYLLTGTDGVTQTSTARTFGAQTVTLTAVGTTLDDRLRTTPVNSGAFTESLMAKDFVFATTTGGLDVTVAGLTAGATYLVELWSFDASSAGTVRTSDWTVNGGILWDDYGFNGANLPATNHDYKTAGAFIANGSGQLVISGRLAANSPAVFLNALRISTLAPPVIVDFGHPIISEFMASNSNGITDEDGATSDWIEIWNTTANALDLAGWTLTNDALVPAKWTFPAGVTVPSQGMLRVWASAKNRTASAALLHTNFTLNKDPGAYLALREPGGAAVTEFSTLPEQYANVSYGLFGTVEPQTTGYFSPSTPLAMNSVAPVPGFVADTTFDIKRGFYTTPKTVHITCATPGATIHYTTDGSEPTMADAVVPAGGIVIATTTVLRVKAFAPPQAPSNTDTQTYIFPAHVGNQPAAPPGWPATWGVDSEVNSNDGAGDGTVPADYEMDPNVVTTTLPGYGLTEALAGLPTLSVTLPQAEFTSVGSGIYANPQSRGDAWERACSIEFIEQDGSGFHTDAGIRVHGTSSRRPFRMQKHSFRLAFRAQYGDGRLDYKLFDTPGVQSFNRLVLRACFTDSWGLVSWDQPRYRPGDSVYFRDVWMKRSFAAMGHFASSGRFTHLYVNGLYWGVYEISERVDATFLADHLGGIETDYDLLGDFVEVDAGSNTAWVSLFTFLNNADMSTQVNYETALAQIDAVQFADYYLLHVHGDAEDWPHKNGYSFRDRVGADQRWKFLVWDQEIALDPLVQVDRMSIGATNSNVDRTAGRLFQRLRQNAEFRLLFADRAHKHLHNGGALALAVAQARWQGIADELDQAIVAESARWGDTADETPYGNSVPAGTVNKRETHWLPTVSSVKNVHLPALHNTANSFATITELRAQSLYPITEPPAFAQFGGNVPVNFALTMTAPAGAVYYTLDGTDPRTAYTGAVAGTLYSGPVVLAQTGTVKARARNGGEWSALTEATFIVGTAASAANLAVTEIHYHPALVEDEEFIELMNFSAGPIDLTGVHFDGITFTFADGTLLVPGERIVVVRNATAFTARYGAGPRVAGTYAGALDNTGEEIAVIAASGVDIVRFRYNDKAPWPTAPDGGGRSLVLRAPTLPPGVADHWRSSVAGGGSPGASESLAPFAGTPLDDADFDGFRALIEHALDTSDADPASHPEPVAVIENVSVSGVVNPYLTITTRVRSGADDLAVTAEWSTDLTDWFPAILLGETVAPDGSVTRKWRAPDPSNAAGAPSQFLRIKAAL